VFLAFVLYPVAYGVWMARDPSLYSELLANPRYRQVVANTVVFVGLGVNLTMFLALSLSGFFMRRRWWIKALLPVFILPWALPAIPAFVSFHWMLIGEEGLVDRLLSILFGIPGPLWFNDRRLALGSDIVAYIWKWLPFWTLTFFAARTAIPQDVYEAAELDGASGWRSFAYVILPLLGNLYLVCTLLSTLWTVGDFTTVYLVSEGAPAYSTDVLATLGFHYAFDAAQPALGAAAVMSAVPLLIPIAIIAMRRLHLSELQL
jgi:multiple sugar transport system permease protein